MLTKQINIKIEPALYAKLKQLAEKNGQTVSSLIRLLIQVKIKEAGK